MYADLHLATAAERQRDLARTAARTRLAALARCCCPSSARRALARVLGTSPAACTA